MAKYKYGIKTFTIAEIDPANGAAVVAGALEVTADVKRDTFQMTEEDGTSVDIYSEMDNTPVGSFEEPGKENLVCELLDTTVERLAFFLGGSVVTAGGLKNLVKTSEPRYERETHHHCAYRRYHGNYTKGQGNSEEKLQFQEKRILESAHIINALDPRVPRIGINDNLRA